MRTPAPETDTSQYFVEALARGLAVLACFTTERSALSLAEITQQLGISKTAVFRSLSTLQTLGYVLQDEDTRRYRPTPRVLDLGAAALPGVALRRTAFPHMQALSQRFRESVSLAVLLGHDIVYLERIETLQLLNVSLAVGSRLPVYCTSMGKVLLAYQPPTEIQRIAEGLDLKPMGPNTVDTATALLQDLELVRRRGFSVNDEELAAGVRSVAGPIRSPSGEVIAAVNMAVPSVRVSLEELTTVVAAEVVAVAQAISRDWNKVCPRHEGASYSWSVGPRSFPTL